MLKNQVLGYVEYDGKTYQYIDKDENGYLIPNVGWISAKSCIECVKLESNPILENVKGLVDKQTEKGLKKYGETVNPDTYTLEEWIVHLQEELVDALVYTETLKEKIKHFKKVVG